jgi:hypothetical protein
MLLCALAARELVLGAQSLWLRAVGVDSRRDGFVTVFCRHTCVFRERRSPVLFRCCVLDASEVCLGRHERHEESEKNERERE